MATAPTTAENLDEEWVNAATHALGLALAAVGSFIVLSAASRHGGSAQVWGCGIYSTTLLAMYGASMLSHLFRSPRVRHAFRIADQAIIFLFIGGTYTPIVLSWLHGPGWRLMDGVVWTLAIAGAASKAIFSHRVRLGTVTTSMYIALGCLPMLAFRPMFAAIPHELMYWLWAGGLCYLAGIIFFHYDNRVPYFHAAWHLLVITGSACHFIGILRFCTAGRA